jgi:hypothetical protein
LLVKPLIPSAKHSPKIGPQTNYCYPARLASTIRYNTPMNEETFVGLLHATREQLHDEPTREVEPRKVAELAGIDPYRIQYAEAVGYLLDHDYIEEYPNHPYGLYRVTNKGLEEILGHLYDPPPS